VTPANTASGIGVEMPTAQRRAKTKTPIVTEVITWPLLQPNGEAGCGPWGRRTGASSRVSTRATCPTERRTVLCGSLSSIDQVLSTQSAPCCWRQASERSSRRSSIMAAIEQTGVMLKAFRSTEEEHAEDVSSLLARVKPKCDVA
jgi:hypothetical protein